MDDLKVGQLVQVTDVEGKQGTSKFVGWTEKHSSLTQFHQLTTEAGNVLKLTGEDLFAISYNDKKWLNEVCVIYQFFVFDERSSLIKLINWLLKRVQEAMVFLSGSLDQ